MGKLKQDHVGPWAWELCGAITSPKGKKKVLLLEPREKFYKVGLMGPKTNRKHGSPMIQPVWSDSQAQSREKRAEVGSGRAGEDMHDKTLCYPMDCSMPGFPVLLHLLNHHNFV